MKINDQPNFEMEDDFTVFKEQLENANWRKSKSWYVGGMNNELNVVIWI